MRPPLIPTTAQHTIQKIRDRRETTRISTRAPRQSIPHGCDASFTFLLLVCLRVIGIIILLASSFAATSSSEIISFRPRAPCNSSPFHLFSFIHYAEAIATCTSSALPTGTTSITAFDTYTITSCTLSASVTSTISFTESPAISGSRRTEMIVSSGTFLTNSIVEFAFPTASTSASKAPIYLTIKSSTFTDGLLRISGSLPPSSVLTIDGNTMKAYRLLGSEIGYSSSLDILRTTCINFGYSGASPSSTAVTLLNANSTVLIRQNDLFTRPKASKSFGNGIIVRGLTIARDSSFIAEENTITTDQGSAGTVAMYTFYIPEDVTYSGTNSQIVFRGNSFIIQSPNDPDPYQRCMQFRSIATTDSSHVSRLIIDNNIIKGSSMGTGTQPYLTLDFSSTVVALNVFEMTRNTFTFDRASALSVVAFTLLGGGRFVFSKNTINNNQVAPAGSSGLISGTSLTVAASGTTMIISGNTYTSLYSLASVTTPSLVTFGTDSTSPDPKIYACGNVFSGTALTTAARIIAPASLAPLVTFDAAKGDCINPTATKTLRQTSTKALPVTRSARITVTVTVRDTKTRPMARTLSRPLLGTVTRERPATRSRSLAATRTRAADGTKTKMVTRTIMLQATGTSTFTRLVPATRSPAMSDSATMARSITVTASLTVSLSSTVTLSMTRQGTVSSTPSLPELPTKTLGLTRSLSLTPDLTLTYSNVATLTRTRTLSSTLEVTRTTTVTSTHSATASTTGSRRSASMTSSATGLVSNSHSAYPASRTMSHTVTSTLRITPSAPTTSLSTTDTMTTTLSPSAPSTSLTETLEGEPTNNRTATASLASTMTASIPVPPIVLVPVAIDPDTGAGVGTVAAVTSAAAALDVQTSSLLAISACANPTPEEAAKLYRSLSPVALGASCAGVVQGGLLLIAVSIALPLMGAVVLKVVLKRAPSWPAAIATARTPTLAYMATGFVLNSLVVCGAEYWHADGSGRDTSDEAIGALLLIACFAFVASYPAVAYLWGSRQYSTVAYTAQQPMATLAMIALPRGYFEVEPLGVPSHMGSADSGGAKGRPALEDDFLGGPTLSSVSTTTSNDKPLPDNAPPSTTDDAPPAPPPNDPIPHLRYAPTALSTIVGGYRLPWAGYALTSALSALVSWPVLIPSRGSSACVGWYGFSACMHFVCAVAVLAVRPRRTLLADMCHAAALTINGSLVAMAAMTMATGEPPNALISWGIGHLLVVLTVIRVGHSCIVGAHKVVLRMVLPQLAPMVFGPAGYGLTKEWVYVAPWWGPPKDRALKQTAATSQYFVPLLEDCDQELLPMSPPSPEEVIALDDMNLDLADDGLDLSISSSSGESTSSDDSFVRSLRQRPHSSNLLSSHVGNDRFPSTSAGVSIQGIDTRSLYTNNNNASSDYTQQAIQNLNPMLDAELNERIRREQRDRQLRGDGNGSRREGPAAPPARGMSDFIANLF